MATVVSHMARDGGGAMPAMQLLIYPVTDSADDTRSRGLFSDGFILTKADMEKFEAAYLPPGVDAVRPADLGRSNAPTCAACRPPTSRPPASTRCATRARPTR